MWLFVVVLMSHNIDFKTLQVNPKDGKSCV
jgi:hypothetical protein